MRLRANACKPKDPLKHNRRQREEAEVSFPLHGDESDPPADGPVRAAGPALELEAEPPDDDADVRMANEPNAAEVIVPAGVTPGEVFRVVIADGRELTVRCPENAGPGDVLEIDLPPGVADAVGPQLESPTRADDEVENVEVEIPAGLHPGQSFNVTSSWGVEFEVEVPRGTVPGSTLFVELPKPPAVPAAGAPPAAEAPAAATISLFV